MDKVTCRCGVEFQPMILSNGRIQKVCATCALECLAMAMEEEYSSDTIKDISDGEQIGADIRRMIGR